MIEYIELYENSFQITEATEKQHHNIISQEVMPTEVRECMLSVESKAFSCTTKYQTQFTGTISKHASLSKL